MAVSLETRCPLLDYRVVEFAWRLPTSVKVRRGEGKWLLKRVLARYVPESLFKRPKQGYNTPVGAWLKGPLRAWAEDLLAAPRLRHEGLLDPERVQTLWREHLSGRRDRHSTLGHLDGGSMAGARERRGAYRTQAPNRIANPEPATALAAGERA